jgi:hypothetical protein
MPLHSLNDGVVPVELSLPGFCAAAKPRHPSSEAGTRQRNPSSRACLAFLMLSLPKVIPRFSHCVESTPWFI